MLPDQIVKCLLDSEDEGISPEEAQYFIDQAGTPNPRIAISYSCITPGRVENGENSDNGWEDEEGVEMTPHEFEEDDEDPTRATAVSKAVEFLQNEGAYHASSSHFYPGIWYTTEYQVEDYETGEEKERSFHLKDFTPEEEEAVWNGMHKRR